MGALLALAGLIAFALSQSKKADTNSAPQLQSPGMPQLPWSSPVTSQPATTSKATTASAKPPEQSAQGDLTDGLRLTIAKVLRDLGMQDDGTLDCKTANAQAIQTATTLAAQLDQMGQQIAAQQLRAYATKAAACVPVPPSAKQIPLPPTMSAAEKEQVARAIALEGDPQRLRALAVQLDAKYKDATTKAATDTLRAKASQLEAAMATASALGQVNQVLKSPGIPGAPAATSPDMSSTSAPLPVSSTPQPGALPQQMSALESSAHAVSLMLKRVQGAAKTIQQSVGKEDQSLVKKFQQAAGLVADGLAGPKTILAIADYEDLVPFVQRWPKGANAATVKQFRADLLKKQTPGRQLDIAAAHEKGQSMGLNVA